MIELREVNEDGGGLVWGTIGIEDTWNDGWCEMGLVLYGIR